jgi:hypothetical protein
MPKKKSPLVPTTPSPYENHAYLNPDGSVDGEKLLSIVRRMPGGFALMILHAMIEKGGIDLAYHDKAQIIIERLSMSLIPLAAFGDEECDIQLTAILKLAQARTYEVPQSKIKELTRYETSPPLARGWELCRIMSHLSNVVEPRSSHRPFRPNHPIQMRPSPTSAHFQGLWDLANSHVKPNTTLQSLAIRLYLDRLEKEHVTAGQSTITNRSLKRDLELVREWERNTKEQEKQKRGRWHGGKIGDLTLTWYEFSEGWKVRAKERATRKQGGSKDRKQLT